MSNIDKEYDQLLDTANKLGNVLSDDDIEKLEDTVEGAIPLSMKEMDNLRDDFYSEDHTIEEQNIEREYDPQSGNAYESLVKNNFDNSSLHDLLNMTDDEIKLKIEVSKEGVQESIDSLYPGIKVSDIDVFMEALNKYRSGAKVSYFNMLPQSMKDNIDMVIGGCVDLDYKKTVRAMIVKEMFDAVIKDNYINTAFTDMQNTIDNTYKELNKELQEEISVLMSNKNVNTRQKIAAMEANIDKIKEVSESDAEKILLLIKYFKYSYTYENLLNALVTSPGKYRAKKIELEKFDRVCNEFNSKYEKNKLTVYNIKNTIPSLMRNVDDITEEYAKRFIIAFTKFTKNMTPDNSHTHEHCFMYFFIKNILDLNSYDRHNEEDSKFYEELRLSINKVIDTLKSIENNTLNKQ